MYIGRFAPSPTGLLHLGSLAAALASWADAQAHEGQWLVRMEDVDSARCKRVWGEGILQQLASVGLQPDAQLPVLWQSSRSAAYEAALHRLRLRGLSYRCTCTRQRLAKLGGVYDGHCAPKGPANNPANIANPDLKPLEISLRADNPASERLHLAACPHFSLNWHDRRLGAQTVDLAQNPQHSRGDFNLRRKDGDWSYALAVVVDDAAQGVTHVVRGADLAEQTPPQILLQLLLELPTPSYLHIAVLTDAKGQKLSKQNHAPPWHAATQQQAVALLSQAAQHLGFNAVAGWHTTDPSAWLVQFVALWRAKYSV